MAVLLARTLQYMHMAPEARAELLSLRGAVEFLDGKMSTAAEAFCEAAKLAPLKDSDSFTLAMAWVNLGDDTHAQRGFSYWHAMAGAGNGYRDPEFYTNGARRKLFGFKTNGAA